MKKLKIIGIILIMFLTTNVYAEEPAVNTFTHGNFTFNITGVKLNVYKMEKNPNNNDNLLEADENNYFEQIPTKTYDLSATEYPISPAAIDKTWKEYFDFLYEHPEIKSLNSMYKSNEGYEKSLKNDKKIQ